MKSFKIFWLTVMMTICLLLIGCTSINSWVLRECWGIKLNEPKNVECIYTYEGRDGEEFEIWDYTGDDSVPEKLELITKENIRFVQNKFNKYVDSVNAFDYYKVEKIYKNFDSSIISCGNYYAYADNGVTDSDLVSYVLLIYDVDTNLLYKFTFAI